MPSVDNERLITTLLEAIEANANAATQAAQGEGTAASAESAARFATAAKDLAEAVNALGIQLTN